MGLFDSLFTPSSGDFYQRYRKANPNLRAPGDYGSAPAPPPGGLFGVMDSPTRSAATADPLRAQPGQGQGYSSYNPSWTERIGAGVQSGLESQGVSRALARDYGGKAETAAGMTPIVGQVLSANDAWRAARAGDMSGLAMAGIGMIPGGGGKVAKAADEIGTAAREGTGVVNLLRKAVPEAEGGVMGALEKTYRHPISSVKLKTALEDINPVYEHVDEMLPEKQFDIEDMLGSYVIPMRGDPTITGKNLKGLMGKMFEEPVHLPGGPQFARGPQQVAEGMGWASNPGPSTALSNRAAKLAKETGKPVYGAYMKMSEHSGDYAAHMGETLRQMYKTNPVTDQAAHDELGAMMAKDWGSLNKKTGKYEFPAVDDWPGFDGLTKEYIDTHPNARKKMVKLLDTKKFQDMGFPASGVARYATTEPDLLNVPSHTSGASVVRFDPEGATTLDPKIPHPTYAQQNKASYVGRLPDIPLDVLYDKYSEGINPGHLSKFLETKPPLVLMDRPTIDRVKEYLKSKHGVKYGLGGAVAMGVITEAQAQEIRDQHMGGSNGAT